MPPGPPREAVRANIAEALARRLTDELDEDHPFVAQQLLAQLAELWQDEPTALATGLAGQAPLLQRLRATFAKSGASEPTIAVLVMLAEVEPAHRAEHLAEVDEILAFADDLAVADNGAFAARAQPIALLQPTVLALPLPWLVDRYVTMLVDRQRAVADILDKGGATVEIVRAHHDVAATGHRIGIALARAGRANEINAALGRLAPGIGNADRELRTRAEIVAGQPTAESYIELARSLRDLEHQNEASAAPDPDAALAVCLTGLVRFPKDPDLLAAAAEHAQALGRIDQPIALYEAALKKTHDADAAGALRLGKLYAEEIGRLALGGRPEAATAAWRDLDRSTRATVKAHPQPAWAEALAGAETALGRGLIAQGQIADGEHALEGSIERAPSIDSYEALATLDVQTDRYGAATQWAERGLELLGETTSGDRYRRAKLERLAGDAYRRASHVREAADRYLDALRTWAGLGECRDLPGNICAERMLESGRMLWWMGDPGRSVELVMHAVDVDADTPSTTAGAVAFLLEIGQYTDAAEACHRGLGSSQIGELYKVYMSLWLVGEGKRRGEQPDRLASEYLASRQGDVWYELLAEAASGHATLPQLRAGATTGPRQAELSLYTATLHLDDRADARALLERVVRARLVMDAEYDLARVYLAKEP